ncbi:MAG: methionyl-tRNA formyltransferase [Caldilineales bacterium]|nr:methionyl-tRNA formyltransferase [Caldilineales bacterium]
MTGPVRTVFMGTPDFAVPSLQALLADPAYQVVGVVTQPDRAAGRGRERRASPVKHVALAAGLPVLQPERLREPAAFAELAALAPELIVVAAYGQILRPEVLNLPRFGCINVHASLLPRWRGAAPIAAAILAGDTVTGVTIMLMDPGMDTGPILAQQAEPILPDDTAATLGARLARLGADLLIRTLPDYLAGRIQPRPQPVEGVTVCRPLTKEQGRMDWNLPATTLARMVRAYDPWPGTYTTWEGQILKILAATTAPGEALPGHVLAWGEGAAVGTGEGLLVLQAVQPAGGRRMPIAAFRRGRPDFIGAVLG